MKQILSALLLSGFSLCTLAAPTLESNGLLTNKDGRTLYTFDKDSANKSNCAGPCLSVWPPFVVANAALADTQFTVLKRDDGVQQWSYQGSPLYLYVGDAKSGDMNGEGQNGVWHVLRANKKVSAVIQPIATTNFYGY